MHVSDAVGLLPKISKFRPSKFELAVMDFYKILFSYYDGIGY